MKGLVLSAFLVVGCIFIASVLGHPGDFDSHGYRLSRIALWLQDGAIFHTSTSDVRMNYSALNGDLLMLWFTAPFTMGYPMVTIVQGLAGLITLLSIWALSRLIGLTRETSLLAVCLMLSMAVFVSQMTTEQVDLLVGAYTVATITLLYAGLRLGLHPLPGALALALALGTKGSMFYFLPGLTVLGFIAIWMEKPDSRKVLRYFSFLLVTLLLFAAPRYVENYFAYGSPFAPKEHLQRLHDNSGLAGFSIEKLRLNSICYAIQVFGPRSNPFGSSGLLHPIGDGLSVYLPREKDPHSISRSRSAWFEQFQNKQTFGEYSLTGSSGAFSFLLCLCGAALAFLRIVKTRSRTARLVFSLFICVVLYHLFMAGFFKWSPFKFRYYLNILPFVAIVGAYVFEHQRFASIRNWSITCLGLFCVVTGIHFFTTGSTSGIGMFQTGSNSLTQQIVEAQSGALSELPEGSDSIAVALPYYARLSGFFRNDVDATVTLFDSDALAGYDSAEHFLVDRGFDAVVTRTMFWKDVGRQVRGLAWDVPGRAMTRDGFEIVRRCRPGEKPSAFVRTATVKTLGGDQRTGFCFTYTIGGELDAAKLIFRQRSQSGRNDVSLMIPDFNQVTQFGGDSYSGYSLPVDAENKFKFCFISELPKAELEKENIYPVPLAINFRPLYKDFTGMGSTAIREETD